MCTMGAFWKSLVRFLGDFHRATNLLTDRKCGGPRVIKFGDFPTGCSPSICTTPEMCAVYGCKRFG